MEGLIDFIPRVKLELVVNDNIAEEVEDVIQKHSHTGNTGDGKIFIINVDNAVKIRNNERGSGAI